MACFFKLSFHAVLICIFPLSFSTDEAGQHDLPIRELIISSYQESLQLVDEAPLHSRQRRNEPSSSTHMFTFHRQTDPETLEISRAAEVFQTTLQVLKNKARQRYKRDVTALELLSSEDIALIGKLSKCPATHLTVCPHFSKYRSISGLCNNRQNPLWGAANTPMIRWLPAEYEDGERQPKGWNRGWLHNGFQLPPPREVSTDIIKSSFKSKDEAYSVLLVEWGQYMSHDITFTPQSTGLSRPTVDCLSTCENLHPCFPIETHDGCMPFHRSLPACFVNPELNIEQALQRQQMNSITSFMDASVVYGHSLKMESFLRDLSGLNGKLAVNDLFMDPKGRPYLPFVDTLPSTCRQNQEGERVECFSAGDTRANEAIPLTTLHTLWLREHNRIAEALKDINRHWTPETIYQETRKIIGALHQVIYIRDYVPKIIGSASFEHYIGPYGGYDPTTDPSTANVFATAAFRFGHATIPPILMRLNESFQAHEDFPHLRLRDTFFSPWRIVKEDEMKTEINPAGLATVANCMEVYFWKCRGLYSSVVMTQGGIEPVLRGIIGTAAPAVNSNMLLAEDVTESLVISKIDRHMDLASLNLQRGRDHGLPGYNDWRVFCGLKYIKTLEDLKEVVGDNKVAEEIQKKYQHLDNIDVWLGGLVEKLLPGSRTGPLFACLIGKQMRVLRDGDRFWWEAEGMFTQQQKAELVKASLSRIICDNSDVREVPYDPFRFETYPSNYLPCNHLPSINLEAWREERSSDLEKCGSPAKIKNGDFILSSASGKLMALYSCYHGFQLKGAAAVVCEGNRWSDQAPQCKGNHH